FLYAEYTGGKSQDWTAFVSHTMELQVRALLAKPDVTTESFKGTIKIFDMKVIRDPTVPGDLDVSACFDNARAVNTSLSTGAVLPGQSPSADNYYRFTDQLAQSPPCLWIPIGDAHTGSQYVIDFYNNTDPGAGALFDGQHAFQEAKQLVNTNPIAAGTWYYLPVNPNDNQAQAQDCLNQPLYFWDPPGTALPGIQIPPETLAQLALAKMNVPQAGKMVLSPRTGNSYSNLPTFSRVTLSFRPEFGPGGLPYVTDNAQLGAQGATVWVEATPLP